jgi:phage-related baseplate assembly protein
MTDSNPLYFRLIDLDGVPPPDFVETLDYEVIRQAAIDYFRALHPGFTAILESDPVIKLIEAFSYRELLLRQRINDAARANTITHATGADLDTIAAFFSIGRIEGETDARFRRRAQLGIYISSVAGPRKAYEVHALSAAISVVDVSVHSPAPGEVVVTVLAFEDVESTAATTEQKLVGKALFAQPADISKVRILSGSASEVIAAVRNRVSADDVRPLTDSVTVRPPNVIQFSIDAKLVIYPGPDAAAVRAAALAALAAYLQSIRKVSYDATLAGIIAALKVPGVQNVILAAPLADIAASYYDLPVCTAVSVVVDRVDV